MRLFLSHGAPTLLLRETPAHRFLRSLGERLPRPRALVVISAHWQTRGVAITGAERPPLIYDFRGFPDSLYETTWPAPGSPRLAEGLADRLRASGFTVRIDPERGLDHGVWVPLSLMYPAADLPVVQVALPRGEPVAVYRRLGEALAIVEREGALLIGSGALTHNLGEMARAQDAPEDPRVALFREAVEHRLQDSDGSGLLDWQDLPFAGFHHPTPEHFLPLLVVAAGRAKCLHNSTEHGLLAMDAWAFE